MNTHDAEFFAPPAPDLLRTPWHRVIGVLPGLDETAATLAELSEAGFAPEEIHAICGEEGVRRLDPSGKHHGLRGRLIRVVETVSTDDTLSDYADDLAAGAILVSVPAAMTTSNLAPRTSCVSTARRKCATSAPPPLPNSADAVLRTCVYSSAWCAIPTGSRPARSQPAVIASNGRPTMITTRSTYGT